MGLGEMLSRAKVKCMVCNYRVPADQPLAAALAPDALDALASHTPASTPKWPRLNPSVIFHCADSHAVPTATASANPSGSAVNPNTDIVKERDRAKSRHATLISLLLEQ